MRARLLGLSLVALWAGQVQAGLFDDDEARKAINDIRQRNEARFDQQGKAQLDLANQLARQAEEIARLRGQLETVNFELETAKKRQQDFYLDLDNRLRRIETAATAPAAAPAEGATADAPAVDTASENQAYEAALNLFKAGKYKDAGTSFAAFAQKYPDSTLLANAQFWLGNAWYAQRNCVKAVEAHSVVTTKFAGNPKAPDSWLGIATCQQEMGNAGAAKKSLETIVSKYPGTPAAETAQQRLKKK